MRSFSLLFAFVYFPCFPQKEGDSWQKVQSNNFGTLAMVYCETPGLIYATKDGSMDGLCHYILMDFTRFIFDKYKKKITLKYVKEEKEFSKFIDFVQNEEYILGVSNTSITEERKKILRYTPLYLHNPMVVLSNLKAPNVNSIDEMASSFKNYRAYVEEETSYHQILKDLKRARLPSISIESRKYIEDVTTGLVKDSKGFAVLNLIEYMSLVKKKVPVKKQNIKFNESEDVAFIMPLNSDWIKPFKEFLSEEYRNSLAYKKAVSKYLGPAFLEFLSPKK